VGYALRERELGSQPLVNRVSGGGVFLDVVQQYPQYVNATVPIKKQDRA
jgi:hypothetical protein